MDNQVDDNPRRWERSCLEEVKARFHHLQSEIAAWGLTILAIELEGAPPSGSMGRNPPGREASRPRSGCPSCADRTNGCIARAKRSAFPRRRASLIERVLGRPTERGA